MNNEKLKKLYKRKAILEKIIEYENKIAKQQKGSNKIRIMKNKEYIEKLLDDGRIEIAFKELMLLMESIDILVYRDLKASWTIFQSSKNKNNKGLVSDTQMIKEEAKLVSIINRYSNKLDNSNTETNIEQPNKEYIWENIQKLLINGYSKTDIDRICLENNLSDISRNYKGIQLYIDIVLYIITYLQKQQYTKTKNNRKGLIDYFLEKLKAENSGMYEYYKPYCNG